MLIKFLDFKLISGLKKKESWAYNNIIALRQTLGTVLYGKHCDDGNIDTKMCGIKYSIYSMESRNVCTKFWNSMISLPIITVGNFNCI